jgi:hypothetical protein
VGVAPVEWGLRCWYSLSCVVGLLPPLSASAKGVKREREGLGLTELHRWPPASSKIYVGQRGEEGEGGFVFVSEEGEAEQLLCVISFSI